MKKYYYLTLLAIIALFVMGLASCGFEAAYTSPKTGIKYNVTEGEDGKPKLVVDASSLAESAISTGVEGLEIDKAK